MNEELALGAMSDEELSDLVAYYEAEDSAIPTDVSAEQIRRGWILYY